MLDMERELLEAIGIKTAKMTPDQVYETAGKALRDRELTTLAESEVTDGVMPAGSRVQVIRAMSPADRLSLRERVTDVVSLRSARIDKRYP
jgi:hypothetical protein